MKSRVMIAEDSEPTRQALKTVLMFHKYEVVAEVENGEEALGMYQKVKPDIVLMDIAMPKKHGIDAIKDIIGHDPDAKIIAVTALYSPEKRKEVLEAGAVALVTKPFDVSDLIREIRGAIGNN